MGDNNSGSAIVVLAVVVAIAGIGAGATLGGNTPKAGAIGVFPANAKIKIYEGDKEIPYDGSGSIIATPGAEITFEELDGSRRKVIAPTEGDVVFYCGESEDGYSETDNMAMSVGYQYCNGSGEGSTLVQVEQGDIDSEMEEVFENEEENGEEIDEEIETYETL